MNKVKITDFFGNEYVNFSSYDNLRKIASLIDGQKNSSRKIIHTILEKNIKEKIKVSQLGSKASEFTEYLHGSLDGVIVNLAQNFPGTNNIPLLMNKGNFGTRFTPEAAASRYIYTYGTKNLFDLFKKEDRNILKNQHFEGAKIEPMFFVPSLPVLVINGSEGVSSGFAQKILPRNPKDVKKFIQDFLKKGSSSVQLIPFFSGFNGSVEQGDNKAQWLIKGKIERVSTNRIRITEVPVGYDLQGYLSVLDDLEDKKIIQSYKDLSENDIFCFEVRIPSKDLKEMTDDELLKTLKLIKTVTENFTALDENNRIKEFGTIEELVYKYIDIKKEFLLFRKLRMLSDLKESIGFETSKYNFVKKIVDGKLVINKRKKAEVVKELETFPDIIKKDDSYDYLLSMNILSLTEERLKKLSEDVRLMIAEHESIGTKTVEQLWMDDLK